MTNEIKNILNKYDLLDNNIFEDNLNSDFDFANNKHILVLASAMNDDNISEYNTRFYNAMCELNTLYTDIFYTIYRLYMNDENNDTLYLIDSETLYENINECRM